MLTRRTALMAFAATAAMTAGATAGEFLKMATLGPGSSPYMVMNTFAQIANKSDADVTIQVNATGAASAHAVQAAQGKLDFFMLAPVVHQYMMDGTAMFKPVKNAPELAKNLRSVFAFPIGYYHVVSRAEDGITSFADLRGRKIFVGPPGGSAPVTMKRMITAATGMQDGVDYEAVSVGWDAGLQAFQDGRLDVYANPTLPPSPVIEQLALSRKIRLIGLSSADLEQPGIQELITRPGGATATIPAGTYGDAQVNDDDILVVASYGGLGTNKDVSADLIYTLTRTFWEAIAAGNAGGPWMRNVTIENALRDLNMPLHPGALRYYDEIGLAVPDDLRPAG
ncbi:TAXI family TRAP transporter solute-binding subunit [Paracoccus sp. (in: a-proteobacteria)]|uniref:TAXI family TRAP transporter solute-binding subunit n=1 Tax=Paracoccus sp. TaxID=267 RepID=UPI003A86AEB3